ncbi:unnamed protein product [Arctogadus glacialis]
MHPKAFCSGTGPAPPGGHSFTWENSVRDVSCMCSATGNLERDCPKTKCFSFNPGDDPIYSTPEEVEWHSPGVVGKRCALVYDHTIYPGIIQETEIESEVIDREI